MPRVQNSRRPQIEKSIIFFVALTALSFLTTGAFLGLGSIAEMRNVVTHQFNQEQLAVARAVGDRIERELNLQKREIRFLADQMEANPFDAGRQNDIVQKSLARVLESGVWKIEVVNLETRTTSVYMPHRHWLKRGVAGEDYMEKTSPRSTDDHRVWISRPRIRPSGITMLLAVPLTDDFSYQLVFHVNLSWFLTPLLKSIHSGKTGYAWLIDEEGFFLFHPDTSFIGKNAFRIREEKYPNVAFDKINFIQKDKMLQGQEGTSWYMSGWHRGITGQIKKLIAFSPVVISANPPQRWSVAVVAPISEIQAAIHRGSLKLFLLQAVVIVVILCGTASILGFEIRWSRRLEKKVDQRTEELKKSEEKYRSLVESAEDFIFTVDHAGNFQSMNSFTANFFGGHPDDFVGKHLASLFPSEITRRQSKLVRLAYHYGKSAREEFEIQLADHSIWISANFMPIKTIRGEVSSILCIARDITENKNLERQLVNAEKLASLGTLAAGVAHEVNNPLGVILGFTDILLRKAEKGSQAFEDLQTIERQGLHCKEVVENLLSFARVEGGGQEFADVNACLEEITKIVRHVLEMNHIELVMRLTRELPSVRCNAHQLQQVFLNLVNNAVAAMNGGGRLTISSYAGKKHRKVVVQFQDSGIGIKAEDIDHIFEPFFTTKPEGQGTGLGLFVSYGIVAKYGGTIDCASQPGDQSDKPAGTTFTVKLVPA